MVIGTKVSQHPEFSGLSAANVAAASAASITLTDAELARLDDVSADLPE